MDVVILINLLIILIVMTTVAIDIYRGGYKSWKEYIWMGAFLLLPIGYIFIHLYY